MLARGATSAVTRDFAGCFIQPGKKRPSTCVCTTEPHLVQFALTMKKREEQPSTRVSWPLTWRVSVCVHSCAYTCRELIFTQLQSVKSMAGYPVVFSEHRPLGIFSMESGQFGFYVSGGVEWRLELRGSVCRGHSCWSWSGS